jgi:hypothetical protein
LTVGSNTGIAANDYIQIDNEIMQVSSVSGLTTVNVTRGGSGALGTADVAHSSGATVQDIQDWIFLSVTAGSNDCSLGGGCLYNFNVTTGAAFSGSSAPVAAVDEDNGTSGVVIDNSSTVSGYSQIYFSTLGNQTCTTSGGTGGCAIQASQSAP